MQNKLQNICFGGQSKAFFDTQTSAIHAHNAKILEKLLFIMSGIMACYLGTSFTSKLFSIYRPMYVIYLGLMLLMLVTFKWETKKHIAGTQLYIWTFSTVIFSFVGLLGTVYEPMNRSVLFIVYILCMPMLFIIPTHRMYIALGLQLVVFAAFAFCVKDPAYAQMDIAHGFTCFAIGMFLSNHILQSRMSLLAKNEELKRRSNVDSLTGISNRNGMDKFLQANYDSASALCVGMVDIDDFKIYNDTYGHPKGDVALKIVATIMDLHTLNAGHFVARFGGEEFIILAQNADSTAMQTFLNGICNAVYEQNIASANAPQKRLTLSIGYAQKRLDEPFEELLKRADDALYHAKKNGKNRCACFCEI